MLACRIWWDDRLPTAPAGPALGPSLARQVAPMTRRGALSARDRVRCRRARGPRYALARRWPDTSGSNRRFYEVERSRDVGDGDRVRRLMRCARKATITRTALNAAIFSSAFSKNAASSAHSDCVSSAAAIGTTCGTKIIRTANAVMNIPMLASKSVNDGRIDFLPKLEKIARFKAPAS